MLLFGFTYWLAAVFDIAVELSAVAAVECVVCLGAGGAEAVAVNSHWRLLFTFCVDKVLF